ncbi:hypothetical protein M407DRAFT_223048 [Tulasnella calospora MUT 4182]|uniref:F-box domain-containing protein n=1 Tax=Tulasnella calospora MUT 4182 TaxID=1051891 RepID=A0A0C3Q7D8_9AGAM|nr:hypothetical protein M407DRAFT_223048 [Tulasnella calospora MUT 4182]
MQSVRATSQSDRDRAIQEPPAHSPICNDFINQLPAEILIAVFRKSLNSVRPGRDLARLGLVCHFWRTIVESTPSLWDHISVEDGIQHVRHAVAKTGEVPLELVYRSNEDHPAITVEDFLTAVMEKSKHWRSVEITSLDSPSAYPGLQSMSCPALEKLTLCCILQSAPFHEPFTLFSGMPSPSRLKELTLCKVPVKLESLELVELEALTLINIGPQSMEEITRILRTSPRLATLVLEDVVGLRPPNTGDTPAIHLQHLDTLRLRLQVPITRFLLSTLHATKLDRLTLTANFSSIPPSMLFTPSITHWVPVLQRMVRKAEKVEIEFDWSSICALKFGKLYYIFHVEVFDATQCAREIMDWHLANLGETVAALPACLSYQDVCPSFGDLKPFSQLPDVTELGVAHTPVAEQVPSKFFKALGSPTRTKPPQWLLPNLRTLHYDLTSGSNKFLLAMLKRRYGPRGSREPSLDQLPAPRSLREIRFFGGIGRTWAPEKDEAFLQQVKLLSMGTQIFWKDELHIFD